MSPLFFVVDSEESAAHFAEYARVLQDHHKIHFCGAPSLKGKLRGFTFHEITDKTCESAKGTIAKMAGARGVIVEAGHAWINRILIEMTATNNSLKRVAYIKSEGPTNREVEKAIKYAHRTLYAQEGSKATKETTLYFTPTHGVLSFSQVASKQSSWIKKIEGVLAG